MNKNLYQDILYGLLTAVLFSAFIYMEHYATSVKVLNTFFGILAIGAFLYIPKRSVLFAGFFIGLFWFYWIGYSFEYNGVGYMTPIITFFFAIFYMLFFGILALTNKVYVRAILFFALSYFEPFDWNWMQVQLVFVDSYIGIMKYQLIIVLTALTLPNYINNKYKLAPLLLIVFASTAMPNATKEQKLSDLKIKLVQTEIKQELKWKRESINPTISMTYNEIKNAIVDGYDVIVFPESVYPLHMNKSPLLIDSLKEASQKITIIAGSLMSEDNKHYNVTYMFQNGEYQVAKKLILVPFGEYVPLPKFARDFINETFFAGTSDFVTATEPSDFIVKGVKFRNAICYEATCDEIYEGEVDFVIATSNNAWFAPSIEPTVQKLLMRYYARKNGVTIYHSANYKGTGIVR